MSYNITEFKRKHGRMGIKTDCQRMIARIVPTATERAADGLGSETIDQASRSFRTDGALIIEDIVDTAIIADVGLAFRERYSRYLDGSERNDALMVGGRRLSITINLEPPFDSSWLFANPYLLPVLNAALDDNFVIGAFGIVCSLPAAPAQHCHDDGGILFPHLNIDSILPTVAITVGIPLLEMNEINGTTALWLGSHRDQNRASREEAIEPVVREGSCILWDFRLIHGGTPNRSSFPRPLLYLTYCRPWFIESMNFTARENPKQKPLLANKNFVLGLPDQHRRLLARAQEG